MAFKLGKNTNSTIKKFQDMTHIFWKDFRKSVQNKTLKSEIIQLKDEMRLKIKSLFPEEFPSTKPYLDRTGKEIQKFFIRRNRIKSRHRKSFGKTVQKQTSQNSGMDAVNQ
jgi:hypothetical protein